MQYDKQSEYFIGKQLKQQARRKKKRKQITFLFLFLLILLSLCLISGTFSIQNIHIFGNHYYTEAMILSSTGIDHNTLSYLTPSLLYERKLTSLPYIKTASIEKNLWNKSITINIEETMFYATTEENKQMKLMDHLGNLIDVPYQSTIQLSLPALIDFSKEERQQFVKDFNDYSIDIDPKIYAQISEIKHYEEPYDKHMVELTMVHGEKIYSSMDSLELINAYHEVLKKTKPNKQTCYLLQSINENNNGFYQMDCSEFKAKD